MPAINFQPRFADMVASGQKRQTIRKTCRVKIGDTVYLYTGQRTKQCRKLGEGVVTAVHSVNLIWNTYLEQPYILVATLPLPLWEIDVFAGNDGFADAREMFDWFGETHGLPFNGWLVKWELKK